MSQGMETFEARLASFDTVLNAGKRRGSSAKSAKPITWPHSRPSPAELAHAGFYYEPHETNPDNTRCFQCESALDGWEEDDNPITEHMTLSPNCGWAIMMNIQRHSSNPAEIEDPTSERITQARTSTFGLHWPHDYKRGWVCQSEKMVTGGWYFCPNQESTDLASCAYCKLSLDGWEPKDDPYEEHYRRSPDCSFFVFAQHPSKKPKASRSKRSRTSKASRLSIQSTASEAPSVDLDEQMDQTLVSEPTTKAKSIKKSSKPKSKTAKSKKAEAEDAVDQMDVDDTEHTNPEPPKPRRATRGKKRSSEQANQELGAESTEHPEPAPKRRATKTRGSVAQQHAADLDSAALAVTQEQSETAPEEEPKKGRRDTKKNTSKGRKVSEDSSTSKTELSSSVPGNAELDAALEADLAKDEPEVEEQQAELAPKQTSKKSKSSKKSMSSREAQPETDPSTDQAEKPEGEQEEVRGNQVEPVESEQSAQTKPNRTSNQRRSKQSKSQEMVPKSRASAEMRTKDAEPAAAERHDSVVSVEVAMRKPEELSDAEPIKEAETSKPKKASTRKGKISKKTSKLSVEEPEPRKEDVENIENIEDSQNQTADEGVDAPDQQEEVQEQEEQEEQGEREEEADDQPARRRSSNIPPKTAERYSDISREKQFAKSLTESQTSDNHGESKKTRDSGKQAGGNVSPLPSARSTPSLSPQSSDAENQPPFTKPSAQRTPVLSPSKQPSGRVPLAASTPSPSKRNANAGSLKTSQPWAPIDIENALFGKDSDKENAGFNGKATGDLSSPEKKMTVDEWIMWNAKNGEERLKQECERLVSQFEKEGTRAMRVLEGIECID